LKSLEEVEKEAYQLGLKHHKNSGKRSNPANTKEDGSEFLSYKKRKMNNDNDREANMLSGKKQSSGIVIGDRSKRQSDTPEDNKSKKISSAISLVRERSKNEPSTEKHEERKKAEFEVEKPVLKALAPDVKLRERKLFGNLLGHLEKAKIVLQNQTNFLEKQQQVVHKVEEKTHKESDMLKESHVKKVQSKRAHLLEEKLTLEREILRIDHNRLYKYADDHYNKISNYILTKEKPQILWIPKKLKESTTLLANESKTSFMGIKDKIMEKSESTLKKVIEDFEEAVKKPAESVEIKNEDEHKDDHNADEAVGEHVNASRRHDKDKHDDDSDSDIDRNILIEN